ncbi:mRNA binding protein puf3 [Malassezia psittaci]|uniref:mRNA binding protein puf3 n=1 Tax=Malassezia psittaci TaxID=1821823 RepID=A0AAF0F8E5_9BASI|nr:mRNA binding protein puf3 [Malassezia psittaci]
MPRIPHLNRSQTLDVHAESAPNLRHVPSLPNNFSLPASALTSPQLTASDDWSSSSRPVPQTTDWVSQDRESSWFPQHTSASTRVSSPKSNDMRGSSLQNAVLFPSADDDDTLLHQQQNAEASVAMALGDDHPGSHTLSSSPTSFSRLGAPGDPAHPPSDVEHHLSRQMRSLTLPLEVSGNHTQSNKDLVLGETPSVISPTSYSPNVSSSNAHRPEQIARHHPRTHTLDVLESQLPAKSSTKASANAFPILPSGPFGPDPRNVLGSPSNVYGGPPLFSPPYSPNRVTAVGEESFPPNIYSPSLPGASGPASAQSVDSPTSYFGPNVVASTSPRKKKPNQDIPRSAWLGGSSPLRLGDFKVERPELGTFDSNASQSMPYRFAPSTALPHDSRNRSRNDSSTHTNVIPASPFDGAQHRRVPQSKRNLGENRHDRHRRYQNEDREQIHDSSHRFDLHDVRGRMVEISTDQHGSRLIQEKLDHCSQEDRDLVFNELYPEARRLMTDVFGNYVIQKLLEYGNQHQVHELGKQLEGHVLTLSLGTYGCRVVQKAFEIVDDDLKVKLSRELQPYVLDCVRDQNANHVIQKILERVPNAHLDFVSTAFVKHVSVLASHCYSCRVLQRIFAFCSESQRRPLLDEMHKDALRLMQDQYGNYVIQWVLQHGEQRDRVAIVRKTKTHLLHLARHKFASNVVEHVIEVAPPADLDDLLNELFNPVDAADAPGIFTLTDKTNGSHCVATIMMQDQYANYVLQRFLQVVQGEGRQRLITTIRPALQALRQMSTPVSGSSGQSHNGAIRLPGGGHIGSKPLLTIERLIDQMSNTTI